MTDTLEMIIKTCTVFLNIKYRFILSTQFIKNIKIRNNSKMERNGNPKRKKHRDEMHKQIASIPTKFMS